MFLFHCSSLAYQVFNPVGGLVTLSDYHFFRCEIRLSWECGHSNLPHSQKKFPSTYGRTSESNRQIQRFFTFHCATLVLSGEHNCPCPCGQLKVQTFRYVIPVVPHEAVAEVTCSGPSRSYRYTNLFRQLLVSLLCCSTTWKEETCETTFWRATYKSPLMYFSIKWSKGLCLVRDFIQPKYCGDQAFPEEFSLHESDQTCLETSPRTI